MKEDTRHEPLANGLPQPVQVFAVVLRGGRGGLYLDADDAAASEFCDEVDFVRRALSQALGRSLESAQARLTMLENVAKYGYPDDYKAQRLEWLRGMRGEDLDRLARSYVKPRNLTVLVVGDRARDGRFHDRFLAEARDLLGFVHPAAVAIREVGQHDGLLYLTLDVPAGETLDRVLEREGPFDQARALRLAGRCGDDGRCRDVVRRRRLQPPLRRRFVLG